VTATTNDSDLAKAYDDEFDKVIVSQNIVVSHHAACRAVYDRGIRDAIAAAADAFKKIGVDASQAAEVVKTSIENLGTTKEDGTL
jgi:bacterioferritin-associated ferredoxin